ncbi:MAG: SAM-dependent methyltransferase [Ilumatobacteraceae bacterium]
MHKSSVYLPEELKRDLGELAARSGRSEADLIRHAIERLVAVPDDPTAPPTVPRSDHPRPALIGVGVGPGDPGLITDRARATLSAADRVVVITTDMRSVGRAEMVVRSVARTARVHRVPFAIASDDGARRDSLLAVMDAVLAAVDADELVAVAVIGDPSQWTVFPELAGRIAAERPGLSISAEPGITSYQAAAASTISGLGVAGSALVVLDDATELEHHLRSTDGAVVLYKASTDAATVRAEASRAGRHDAVVAELSGLPGQRLVALADADDGPISYLATVVFPARRLVPGSVEASVPS